MFIVFLGLVVWKLIEITSCKGRNRRISCLVKFLVKGCLDKVTYSLDRYLFGIFYSGRFFIFYILTCTCRRPIHCNLERCIKVFYCSFQIDIVVLEYRSHRSENGNKISILKVFPWDSRNKAFLELLFAYVAFEFVLRVV